MAISVIQGDVHVVGRLTAADLSPSASSISDSQVAADAGISASKLEQQIVFQHRQAAPATVTEYVHIARGAGEIVALRAVADTVPAAANSYTIDVLKNGTTILTSVITINDSTTADDIQEGLLSVTSYVADDLFKIVVTVSGGGSKGTNLLAQLILREAADA